MLPRSKGVDKDAMRVSHMECASLSGGLAEGLASKSHDEPDGFIEGLGAAFGNIDLQKEIIRKGTFAKTIEERVPAGRVKLLAKHAAFGGDTKELLGTVTRAKETDKGLWFHGRLGSWEVAQTVRKQVMEGHVDGSSVGFFPLEWKWISAEKTEENQQPEEILEHREGKLLEITITNFPANEKALLTRAKSNMGFDDARVFLHQIEAFFADAPSLDCETKDLEQWLDAKKATMDGVKELTAKVEQLHSNLLSLAATAPSDAKGKTDPDLEESGIVVPTVDVQALHSRIARQKRKLALLQG